MAGHLKELRELERLAGFKRSKDTAAQPLGPELISFFNQSVSKRQTRLAKIAEAWGALVPDALTHHCSLEGYNRGTLSVLVDSSSHLYELRQLLSAGLQNQLLLACKSSGLRKVVLRPGRWYEARDDAPVRRPRFK